MRQRLHRYWCLRFPSRQTARWLLRAHFHAPACCGDEVVFAASKRTPKSNLNPGEQVRPNTQEDTPDYAQNHGVQCRAEIGDADECCAQPVDAIRERVQ